MLSMQELNRALLAGLITEQEYSDLLDQLEDQDRCQHEVSLDADCWRCEQDLLDTEIEN